MPVARFQMPDGRVARFEVPDGTTPEQAQSMMEAHFAQPQQAKPQREVEDPGAMKSAVIGFGRTADKVLDGMTQAYLAARGENSALGGLKKTVDAKTEAYQPLQEVRPWSTGIGESLPYMAIPVGSGATALGTAGRLAMAGSVPGLIEYGSVADRLENAAKGAIASTALGVGVPKLLAGVKRGVGSLAQKAIGNVSDEARALYRRATELGIPVNAGQLTDSKIVKTAQSVAERVPLNGGKAFRDSQQAAFNRAVGKTFGADASKLTDDVYSAAKSRIGKDFEALTARNSLKVSEDLIGKLGSIERQAAEMGSDESIRAVRSSIDRILKQTNESGMMPGRAYQSLDSELGGIIKNGGEKAHFLGQLREAVRSGMDESISAADKAAWGNARSQYGALKTVRDLISKSPEGDISPAALMGRVTANNAGKEAMATGRRGDLGDLAKIGQRFIKDPIPDSGTASRLTTMTGLGATGLAVGGPLGAVALPITAIAGGKATTKLLNSDAIKRGLLSTGGPSFQELMMAPGGLLASKAGQFGGLLSQRVR